MLQRSVLVMESKEESSIFLWDRKKVDPCLVGAYRMFRSYQGLLRDLSDWLLRRTRHATRIPLRMVMDRESRGWLLLFVVLLFLCDNLVKYL
jgi:hypothetical protein